MFTGLIEEVAEIRRLERTPAGARITLSARRVLEGTQLGDSIAVNGACLTVTHFTHDGFTADAVPETLRRTTLGSMAPGDLVNVERALRLGDRLGGHMVSGHVDGVGMVRGLRGEGLAAVLSIETSDDLMRYIAEKGSIAVDGVSLTVMDTDVNGFRVSIIPHTGQQTTLLRARVGQAVNLECDVIAKYVERLLQRGGASAEVGAQAAKSGIDLAFLQTHGFTNPG